MFVQTKKRAITFLRKKKKQYLWRWRWPFSLEHWSAVQIPGRFRRNTDMLIPYSIKLMIGA